MPVKVTFTSALHSAQQPKMAWYPKDPDDWTGRPDVKWRQELKKRLDEARRIWWELEDVRRTLHPDLLGKTPNYPKGFTDRDLRRFQDDTQIVRQWLMEWYGRTAEDINQYDDTIQQYLQKSDALLAQAREPLESRKQLLERRIREAQEAEKAEAQRQATQDTGSGGTQPSQQSSQTSPPYDTHLQRINTLTKQISEARKAQPQNQQLQQLWEQANRLRSEISSANSLASQLARQGPGSPKATQRLAGEFDRGISKVQNQFNQIASTTGNTGASGTAGTSAPATKPQAQKPQAQRSTSGVPSTQATPSAQSTSPSSTPASTQPPSGGTQPSSPPTSQPTQPAQSAQPTPADQAKPSKSDQTQFDWASELAPAGVGGVIGATLFALLGSKENLISNLLLGLIAGSAAAYGGWKLYQYMSK